MVMLQFILFFQLATERENDTKSFCELKTCCLLVWRRLVESLATAVTWSRLYENEMN